MTRMSEISHLFDAHYHTFERLRASSMLLSAVLGVAARFRRPDLARQLLEHTDRLLFRNFGEGQITLAIVQTLLVTVHWKHPDDRSAYMRLGLAFRAACQLQLGSTIGQPLPSDETSARALLNAERTWLSERFPYHGKATEQCSDGYFVQLFSVSGS
jgi:hypothetical protein